MEDFKLDEKTAEEFGKYIKNIREERGFSTNKVEILTNIKKSDLSRIENGKKKIINAFYIKEFARIYKVDVIDLFKRLGFIDERVGLMNKREKIQFENILSTASHFFNDENVSEEDKLKMRDSLLEAFYDAKAKNKKTKLK